MELVMVLLRTQLPSRYMPAVIAYAVWKSKIVIVICAHVCVHVFVCVRDR